MTTATQRLWPAPVSIRPARNNSGLAKNRKLRLLLPSLLILGLLFCVGAYAQITPSGDAYTNTAASTTNYGSGALLYVNGATEAAYIQFNLASIPSNASISQATLKLYVNGVTTAGSFNVDYASGSWLENKIDASNAPAPGTAIASSINVTAADKNQYILVNITSAVEAWLSGSETNNGIVLVANSSFDATFDSKENATTSHPAELDIAYASGKGGGTITGVTTASGSGLAGGGTSGTLNLSLTNSCTANQVLEWSGTEWVCTTSKGAGTVTSVGLTAPSSDFTVTGSPVTTSGALALNWNTAPTNADAANTIVKRDSNGGFFAGSIVAVGNAGAAPLIGSDSSSVGVGAVQGMSANGIGVYGVSTSTSTSSNNEGVYGSGYIGVVGAGPSSSGIGVFGSSGGTGVEAYGVDGVYSVGTQAGVYAYGNNWGVAGTSQSSNGVGGGFYNTTTGTALFAENQTKGSYAAFFLGNVDVDGVLSKPGGSFKIDDPIDPAHKYLYHSFVESPDMMNIYNGNVTTDGSGLATVTLPNWFEALNRDFRYQLTVIGQFAQAMVENEVSNHEFTIKTDKPNVKVSWQVTGIRQDAWANANRIPVEVSKAPADQGLYLHPELFGASSDKSIALAHYPAAPPPPKPDPTKPKNLTKQ
jgi:TGF-beta propeptide